MPPRSGFALKREREREKEFSERLLSETVAGDDRGRTYLDCCQSGLLSVFSLSGRWLFSQASVEGIKERGSARHMTTWHTYI